MKLSINLKRLHQLSDRITLYEKIILASRKAKRRFDLNELFVYSHTTIKLENGLHSKMLLFQQVLKITVLEPHCNRAAWVRSRFEPQELIDVQLERRLATRYLYGVVLASTKLLSIIRFIQSRGLLAAIFLNKIRSSVAKSINRDNNSE